MYTHTHARDSLHTDATARTRRTPSTHHTDTLHTHRTRRAPHTPHTHRTEYKHRHTDRQTDRQRQTNENQTSFFLFLFHGVHVLRNESREKPRELSLCRPLFRGNWLLESARGIPTATVQEKGPTRRSRGQLRNSRVQKHHMSDEGQGQQGLLFRADSQEIPVHVVLTLGHLPSPLCFSVRKNENTHRSFFPPIQF